MELLIELTEYYGNGADKYIKGKIKSLEGRSDRYKQEFLNYIFAKQPKNFGFPDVSVIEKAIKEVPPDTEKTRRLFWKVCDVCGTAYGYDLDYCPSCYNMGKTINSYRVATGESFPPSMVRLNISGTSWELVKGKNCFTCHDGSYCRFFGNDEHTCGRMDFENCSCRQCCLTLKKYNRQEKERRRAEDENCGYDPGRC